MIDSISSAGALSRNGPFLRLDPSVQQLLTTLADGSQLHGRLRDVLACLLDGLSEKETATLLNLSKHTVHGYVKALYRRFGVESHPQLIAEVYRSALAKMSATCAETGRQYVLTTCEHSVVTCAPESLGQQSIIPSPREILSLPYIGAPTQGNSKEGRVRAIRAASGGVQKRQ